VHRAEQTLERDVSDALPTPPITFAQQPTGVAWPTSAWPTGTVSDTARRLADEAFSDPALETTYAVVVVQHGRLLYERYGGALPNFTHEPTPVTVDTPLLSWSMAKSVLHAAIGLVVDRGLLDPDAVAPVEQWQAPGDERARVTVRQLLQMRDGLEWNEDYVDDAVSNVIEMLFGSGTGDVAGYAHARPLAHPPGTRFNYSSGTSNILAAILGGVVGHGEAMRAFLHDELFAPTGMHDATVTIDDAGTFVGSSYVHCTAQSYARFATLYLRGGVVDGRRVLSERWVADAQVPTSHDDASTYYSHHWWLDGEGRYWASGYEGQRLVIDPARDAILVRLGRTDAARYPAIRAWCDSVLSSLERTGGDDAPRRG
jgi:CubicO group peptidase (beta-lactamase class C family)